MGAIDPGTYREKVYGGWLGKNIGGTLGMPLEGLDERHDVDFYPELPDDGGPAENDDLDIQLVWLHAVEEHGPRLDERDLAAEWVEHVFFPMDEYGYASANMRRGVAPPVSGWFNNPFADCMGSPIRSEVWAMLAPGVPGLAARYAYRDAVLDHAGGEGVAGEVLCAAMESAAFVEDDPGRLVEIGLDHVPDDSRVGSAVADVRDWHEAGHDWVAVRDRVLDRYGSDNVTEAPMNIAFAVLGLLDGDDYGDALTTCVNCGYDTDSSGATLGALLGILAGRDGIPDRWREPVGDGVAVSPEIVGVPTPDDLHELTDRTVAAARQVLAAHGDPVRLASGDGDGDLDAPVRADRFDPADCWRRSPTVERATVPAGSTGESGIEVAIDYGDAGPAVGRDEARTLAVTVANGADATWTGTLGMDVPEGWSRPDARGLELGAGESATWHATVRTPREMERARYDLAVTLDRSYYGGPWTTGRVPFALVTATHWSVEGPGGTRAGVTFPGNELRLSAALDDPGRGTYSARSTMVSPAARTVRLVVGCRHPTRVWVDGEQVVDADVTSPLRPAFHPLGGLYPDVERKNAVVDLSAGETPIELEIDAADGEATAWVVPLCHEPHDDGVPRPLPYFQLTDVTFA